MRPSNDGPASSRTYPRGVAPGGQAHATRTFRFGAGLRKEGPQKMQTTRQAPRGRSALVLNSLSVEAGLIQKWLEAEGYRVEVVANKGGFEARVEKDPPDLVVMAQIEAGWGAATLFQELKANESTKNIPIVFLATTGVPQVEQAGGVLLRRPFGAGALIGAVRKAMDSKG